MRIMKREPSNTLPRTELWTVQPDAFDFPLWVVVTQPATKTAATPLRGQITTDGNHCCGTMFQLSTYLEMAGMPATLQVSVGYAPDHPIAPILARDQELTPTHWPEWDEPYGQMFGLTPPPSGKAARFLAFLADELMPALEQTFGVDPKQWTLAGHSLGGLFSIHALFERPERFARYFAVGSSFWWQAPMMQRRAEAFAAEGTRLNASVYLAAGDAENPEDFAKAWKSMEALPAWNQYLNVMGGIPDIVGDTRRMAEVLTRRAGVKVRCDISANENHSSAVFVAYSQGMRWLNASEAPA